MSKRGGSCALLIRGVDPSVDTLSAMGYSQRMDELASYAVGAFDALAPFGTEAGMVLSILTGVAILASALVLSDPPKRRTS